MGKYHMPPFWPIHIPYPKEFELVVSPIVKLSKKTTRLCGALLGAILCEVDLPKAMNLKSFGPPLPLSCFICTTCSALLVVSLQEPWTC